MGGGAERCATWTRQFQRALALGVNKFLWHEAFWGKKKSLVCSQNHSEWCVLPAVRQCRLRRSSVWSLACLGAIPRDLDRLGGRPTLGRPQG